MVDAASSLFSDYVAPLVENWMDVLLIGLSAELFPAERLPQKMTAVKAGALPPAGPWDAVLLRADRQPIPSAAQSVEKAVHGLRAGGIAIIAADEEAVPMASQWLKDLSGVATSVLSDGTQVLVGRKLDAGTHDLVGLRRSLRQLAAGTDRLERIVSDTARGEASQRTIDGGWSIKELVAHLADMDREGYLRLIRAALERRVEDVRRSSIEELVRTQDYNARPLAELVTRFRHFRAQSQEFLNEIPTSEWLTPAQDLEGATTTLAVLVRTWCREEARGLETLDRRVHPDRDL